MLRYATALILLSAMVPAGTPTLAGDPAAGRLVALRSCAACHAIAARETWYTDYARGFAEIARDPALTEAALRRFLGRTHRMFWPGAALSPRDTDDVIAYISTLKPP